MSENTKSDGFAALVVGVDGSAGAAAALGWALAESGATEIATTV